MNEAKLKGLAKDLSREYPRSPRDMLGGYVILARCLDKCRSELVGIEGEYSYWPCALCSELEPFTGIDHDDLRDFVATGATDDEIAAWTQENSKVKDPTEIVRWNNQMREKRFSDLSEQLQVKLEGYIQEHLPPNKPLYVWFDLYDIEEERI
jgi:hypothetical protein